MNATFGIDLDALIGGDFKADDGLGATCPLGRSSLPARTATADFGCVRPVL